MLFDTHAHVNFKAYEADADDTIRRALDAGVSVVNVGTQLDTSRQCLALAEKYDRVYAVIGLHPVHTYTQHLDEEETSFRTREEHFDTSTYRSLAQSPKVIGIGECGLDYYRMPDFESSEERERVITGQKEAFTAQIRLAAELDKALVIHSRSNVGSDDACLDILDILQSEMATLKSPVRFVLHSYTGSPDVLQKFLDIGSYVSFNGIVTFDKTGNMEQLVKMAPLARILLETDCPFLTPVPHRGKRNEPAYVQYVAQKVAELKGVPVEEVVEQTGRNAVALFMLTA